ncbi:GNAT family N-acetyltransferase [Streptomyces sp. 549]|uniref:GNAT family N-acetyltransferase n=1 Tax=Streptomyces sp. 549 TaxID=3049076 RepID=UPI0032E35870
MWQLDTEVSPERRRMIEARLSDTNSLRSPVMSALRGTTADEEVPVQVCAFTDDGRLAAGLIGYAWGRWLHVELLWVAEGLRGGGLGSHLVHRAEELARTEHGCLHSRVETWDFQAPGFYLKLGYRLIGTVPDYPPGCTDHLLVKALS